MLSIIKNIFFIILRQGFSKNDEQLQNLRTFVVNNSFLVIAKQQNQNQGIEDLVKVLNLSRTIHLKFALTLKN